MANNIVKNWTIFFLKLVRHFPSYYTYILGSLVNLLWLRHINIVWGLILFWFKSKTDYSRFYLTEGLSDFLNFDRRTSRLLSSKLYTFFSLINWAEHPFQIIYVLFEVRLSIAKRIFRWILTTSWWTTAAHSLFPMLHFFQTILHTT